MNLFNSLTKKVEEFVPLTPPKVGLYTCGMTVYDFAHIGHGRKYVGDDILRRMLMRFGYDVTHVQNVTDVGHLVSDEDSGEDKLEKGAKKQGKTVWEVADFFTKHFFTSMDALGNLRPTILCKATEHVPEQIALIEKLISRGIAYDTPEAVYFDISKFPGYSTLFGNQELSNKKIAVRQSIQTGDHKKNQQDFALWFKRVGRFSDHVMHWDSPWGDGFPGWHIECSAMSMKYLGDTIDIHTGGIEHTAVHHPNEIAQSEGATGKQFVRIWVHYGHLMIDATKMSKSLGNVVTIEDIVTRGFDPKALRYFYLTAHYRKPLNFTWESLSGASNALTQLRSRFSSSDRNTLSSEKLDKIDVFRRKFDEALADDMNTPQALAVVWEVVKSSIPAPDKRDLLLDFDTVLGVGLGERQEIPSEIKTLMVKRKELRKQKKFDEADTVRVLIESKGYKVEDESIGT